AATADDIWDVVVYGGTSAAVTTAVQCKAMGKSVVIVCPDKHLGGLTSGGFNFDAKVRRESFEPIDLFHAHIGGMDAFARGFKIASAMQADKVFENILKERYSSWDSGIGAKIEAGEVSFADLEEYMLAKGDAAPNASGRQEMIENIVNDYIV
ncbi:MAG: FAD-dependent oxidoreductase, partial [Candidatus Poribacteria bacterium]